MARPPLYLFTKGWNATARFIFRDTLDAPHGKKQIAKSHELLAVYNGAYPIIEGIEVEAAQEYSSMIDLVEYAPTLLPRSVQDKNYWCPTHHRRFG
jgi:hypothetical protein